jgi:hypothetical protein
MLVTKYNGIDDDFPEVGPYVWVSDRGVQLRRLLDMGSELCAQPGRINENCVIRPTSECRHFQD